MSYSLHVSNVDLKDKSPLARHVLIKIIGLSMVSMFLPAILRYEYGLSLSQIFLFEASYSLVVLAIMYFFSLQFTARFGTVASMVLGVSVFSANFIVLYLAKTIPWLLILSPLLSGFYTAYFWVGYHAAMSMKGIGKNHLGSANSFIESVGIIAGLVGPLMGGVLADYFGSSLLYVVTFVCLFFSCVPLFFHQRTHIPFSFTPRKSVHRTTRDRSFFKAVLISFSSMGYVYFVGSVVWTLILYKLLGTYTKLALVSVVSSLILIVVLRYIGRIHDSHEGEKQANIARLLKRSFRSQSGTWLFASFLLFSGLLTQLFFVCIDTIHKITYRVNELSLMNYFYEEAGGGNQMSKVLDTIFIRELSIHGSRILFCLLLAGITYLLKGKEDWGLILSLFFVFLVAPFGEYLLTRKQQHVSVQQQKKTIASIL